MNTKLLFAILLSFVAIHFLEAQIDIEGKIRSKSYERADQLTDEVIDRGLDEIEEEVVNLMEDTEGTDDAEDEEAASPVEKDAADEEAAPTTSKARQDPSKQKLEAFTQYDFVAGDKILYYEDFAQDAIGDFPALWTTDGSGEVKTLNIAPGHWLHMNGQEAVYCYTKAIDFPTNFIMEFDIIPDENFDDGIQLSFYADPENKEFTDDLFPGEKGIHIEIKAEGWETLGYDNVGDQDWLTGHSQTNPVVNEQVNHVVIWVQNRRVRIYHRGRKVLDMPTNIFANTKFTRFRFSGWNRNVSPFVSNLKITTASPDTRSKLLTDGKLVSYGIYFDSGKDVVKPESYGAIKEIAAVLKENPSVKIRIVGHTDSDGDDAKNLDLSKRRAASVKSYLVNQFQADGSNIEIDGKGEGSPLESNNTADGKAKNRRVEFIKL